MKALLLLHAMLAGIEWRHHGLGMLQGYINPELRAHIFAPWLVHPTRKVDGRIHNHRYNIHSSVLTGGLVDRTYRIARAGDGSGNHFTTAMGRYVFGAASESGQDDIQKVETVRTWSERQRHINPGDTYFIPKWEYHESLPYYGPFGVVVTLVYRSEIERDKFASVLAHDRPCPGMVKDMDPELVERSVKAARSALMELLEMKP